MGGGGAPGLTLPGWAVALPASYAAALRSQPTPVLARVEHGQCLVDLRCIAEAADSLVAQAIRGVSTEEPGVGTDDGDESENDGVDGHGGPR